MNDITITDTEIQVRRRRLDASLAAHLLDALGPIQKTLHDEIAIISARGLAATVVALHPGATTIELVECDQAGCLRLHVSSVNDADGQRLDDELDPTLADSDEVVAFESGLGALANGAVVTRSDDYVGVSGTLTIELALRYPPLAPLVSAATSRGTEILAYYAARHDQGETSSKVHLEDLLSDLDHWAHAHDVDLEAILTDARAQAEDERSQASA
jgi:hypothetical protein